MSLEEYAEYMEAYADFQEELGAYLEMLIGENKEEILAPVKDGIVNPGDLEAIASAVFKHLKESPDHKRFLQARHELIRLQARIADNWAKKDPNDFEVFFEFETTDALTHSLLAEFEESELFEINL